MEDCSQVVILDRFISSGPINLQDLVCFVTRLVYQAPLTLMPGQGTSPQLDLR